MPVALSFVLAAALASGAYVGSVALLLAVALTQGLVVAGWYHAVGAPGAGGGMLVCTAAAGCGDLLLFRDDARPLGPVTGVLGLTMVGVLLHQLARSPRDEVTASMAATAALASFVVLVSFFLAALQTRHGETRHGADMVAVVAAAVAAARLADLAALMVPLPDLARVSLALPLAAVAGLTAGAATEGRPGAGLLMGLVAGVAVAAGAAFAGRLPHPNLLTSGALPVALAGPVAYALGRVVLG